MSFIFGRKKGPVELVRSTKKHIDILTAAQADDEKTIKKVAATHQHTAPKHSNPPSTRLIPPPVSVCVLLLLLLQSMEKLSANLAGMKMMLYGDAESEPKEADIARLVDELFASNLLLDLLLHMRELEFEARKDVARVYDFVLRQKARKEQSLEYVRQHPDILRLLVEGYTDQEVALNCGSILREVIRHEELAELALQSPLFDLFFDYVQLSTFDIASDAFATFKLILTKHKTLSARYLDAHYDAFVQRYNVLLQSRNYVTKRQSLKLLGELLLNRSNFSVMMRYINAPDNLKIMMNLLRGNCFPVDHQVLTSAGFVSLPEAKMSAAAGQLEVACWVNGRLEYHPATVVEAEDKERVFVSIGGPTDKAHVDLCVTDNHRVFGRVGLGIRTSNQWSRRGKVPIVPPLAVHEAGGLLEYVEKAPTTVLQLVAYAEHGLAASGEPLPFAAPLGLTTNDQIDDFLQLYGYWLGDGWLSDGKIGFGPSKSKNMLWLEPILARLLTQQPQAIIGQPGFWRADTLSADGQRFYYITEPSWVQLFYGEYGHKYLAPRWVGLNGPFSSTPPFTPTTFPSNPTLTPEPLEPEGIKSAKWFWYWVYRRLGVRRLRLLLAAIRMADGDEAQDLDRIYTSSARFRDELVRVALHAGYSAAFTIKERAGDVNGVNRRGVPILARYVGYCVCWTVDTRSAVPKEKVSRWVTSAAASGPVWCVTVPQHTGQLIVVRRVTEMQGDVVVDASRPVVVGNTRAIQFEAFHVFKIFVANPKKSAAVVDILVRNKRKLIDFLHKFHKDKEDDQFNEEKNTLLTTLQALPDPQQGAEGADGGEAEEEKKEEGE